MKKELIMKLKEMTDGQLEEIAGLVDNEGFYYLFAHHGGMNLDDILESKDDITNIENAIKILREFESSLPEL